ncbi:MAG: hypothetical protein IPH65_00940 [Dehalococcoidia bacterium]|uniref:AAA family ATPase n=1 Tax=Candidatus Amarobacter glycogenicus TaxID=3140699 RepID=UPI003135920C|nr:hypothetical protein [Dehalococcoidia bacterium]MBK7124477.1 hypothetical protein [Dehalococcoidia bacterium]MBK9341799.1 hypothetical protein [Dehalococcoidia bacterium]
MAGPAAFWSRRAARVTMSYVLIVGPPAVGKATVAREVARLTGFRLVPNTLTAEMLLDVFRRSERPFSRLHVEFQQRILEEAAAAGVSLVGTAAWAFDEELDWAISRSRFEAVRIHGGKTFIAELEAPFVTRLVRNHFPDRVRAKPNQQATLTDDVMREMEAKYRLSSDSGELDEFGPYLRIDTTRVSAGEAARLIVAGFGLPLTG